jgi:hypothetical protein
MEMLGRTGGIYCSERRATAPTGRLLSTSSENCKEECGRRSLGPPLSARSLSHCEITLLPTVIGRGG